ncbi:ctd kinase subunit beta [Acrodontium crateriforme]|uniref:Ctd kinase subunit beta n=1 Tax=Acrodontium crateriforme TaxID=150365 RepID=A0AAQ3LWQ6_9PEZI|nr:ctd kinase subunit beta [Acrodontium crateriforme]
MVYVEWKDYGICKFWMADPDKCRNGRDCPWGHPRAGDRERLWQEHTERQEIERRERRRLRSSSRGYTGVHAGGVADDEERRSAYRKRKRGDFTAEDWERAEHSRHHHAAVTREKYYDKSSMIASPYRERSEHDSTEFTQHSPQRLEPHIHHRWKTTDQQIYDTKMDRGAADTSMYVNSQPLGRPNRMLNVGASTQVDEDHALGDTRQRSHLPWTRKKRNATQQDGAVSIHPKDMAKTIMAGPEKQDEVRSVVRTGAAVSPQRRVMRPPPRLILPPIHAPGFRMPWWPAVSIPANMPAVKRDANGEVKQVGPHPSTIRVSTPYTTQAGISKRLRLQTGDIQEKSLAEAREDNFRLQGVTWLDTTRRALQLPIRTFSTACVYYHKFRLAHAGVDYNWADAAAASLFTSCKVEDTLKKSKDILAAAYNVKTNGLEQLGSDDPLFEGPSRAVIGLERLVLESGGFDFRSRYPHRVLVKITRTLPESHERSKIGKVAWSILTDLHRTFAPLKQSSSTLALASLELAVRLTVPTSGTSVPDVEAQLQPLNHTTWSTTREEVMETLLDALDLYTHHTASTILGTTYVLDDFLRIRLALNKECTDSDISRYTTVSETSTDRPPANATGTLRVSNGHPTPVSPPQPGGPPQSQTSNGLQTAPDVGTLRFMLNPRLAADEKGEVKKYFVEEWEEYEEEIEVPVPRSASYRGDRPRDFDRRDPEDRRPLPVRDERELLRQRERELEREQARLRERGRDRRYDDRRYDDRDRRYDDRRGPPRRFDDRRPYEGDRRHPPRRDDRR